jgi:hypothetical protein
MLCRRYSPYFPQTQHYEERSTGAQQQKDMIISEVKRSSA